MKIVKIERKIKGMEIHFDNGESMFIEKDTFLSSNFEIGRSINTSDVKATLAASDEKRAYEKAIRLLAFKRRTAEEIRQRLYEEEIGKEAASAVINKLLAEGFLDDQAYAEDYYTDHHHREGPYKIRMKLREKGISEDILSSISMEEDLDQLATVMRKKYGEDFELTQKNKAKVMRFMTQRGFSYDKIKKSMALAFKSDENM